MYRKLFCLAFLALVVSSALYGQTLGGIVGEVKDAAGAVIVGATVTATNTGTNAARSVPTNQSGMYSFPGLVPGPYSVKVEMTGFRPVARTLDIQVQQTARADFNLEVGQLNQAVEVTAQAALLNTEDATVGTVIEQRRISELPLNGRDYLQLVALSPNVSFGFQSNPEAGARQGGNRAGENMSIAGARSTWNNFTLDGVANTDPNYNTYVVQPSVDMLQEFKVQSGVYPAEFGRAASQINVSTRSGNNQYHGSVYEFVRNDKMDARSYDFTVADHARAKNPFQWNQYGFVFGGPVQIPKVFNGKDKLFFMSNFERFRQVQRPNSTYSVASLKMRTGDFSEMAGPYNLWDPEGRFADASGKVVAAPVTGNIIPLNRQSAQTLFMLNYMPLPNQAADSVFPNPPRNNFVKTQHNTTNKDQFHLRMDWVESAKSAWFGRYSWTDDSAVSGGMYLNGRQTLSTARQYMISNTRVFSPSVFNEFRFGINKLFALVAGELAYKNNVLAALKIPNMPAVAAAGWAIPAIEQIAVLSVIGGNGDPYETRDAAFQAVDNIQIMRGKHSIRFGGEIRRDRYNQFGNQFLNPSFWYDGTMTRNPATKTQDPVLGQTGGYGLADFFYNYTARVRYAPNPVTLQLRQTSQAYYVDEIWRVKPGLTINMGLRYEYLAPYSDRAGNLVNISLPKGLILGVKNVPDASAHPTMVRSGSGDFYQGIGFRYQSNLPVARDGRLGTRLVQPDKNNFAPRFGIAWNPSPKWSFRTGAGIFYSAEVANTRFDLGRSLGGRAEPTGASNFPTVTMNNFLGPAGSVFTLPASPWTWMMRNDIKDSYTFQYLFNVQHEFSQSTVMEFGYMGSQSRHLWGLYDSNEPLPSADGSAPATRAPYPEFGIIQTVHSDARGNYNGASVKLTRRFGQGMTALLGYTFSKSMDMVSAWRGQGDSRSANTSTCYLKCEYAPSGFDTPHRVTASLMYDLPFGKGKSIGSTWGAIPNHILGGWQINSIITIQSGRRGNFYGSNNSLAYIDGQRPSATGQTLNLPDGQRSTERWFNEGAIKVPAAGVIGNIGRNVLLGPAQQSWDLSLLKNFRVREGHSIAFRAEAFNFANHPVFSRPGLTTGNNVSVFQTGFNQIRGTDQSMRQIQLGLKYTF